MSTPTTQPAALPPGLTLVRVEAPVDGRSRRRALELHDSAAVTVCRLTIDDLLLRDGHGGTVHVAGIGNVYTHDDHRRRGLAAGLMDHTMADMRASGAAISLLYGIDGFYHRWGYVDCGDDHLIELHPGDAAAQTDPSEDLAAGWTMRRATADDLAEIIACHDACMTTTPGSVARDVDGEAWTLLRAQLDDAAGDACRVAVDQRGRVRAYGWRARTRNDVDTLARRRSASLVLGELCADSAGDAATAAVVLARAWRGDAESVIVPVPPSSPVYDAAMRTYASHTRTARPDGGAMAVPLRDDITQPTGWFQLLPDRF